MNKKIGMRGLILSQRKVSGLTLLEMLVALAILGIVLRWASGSYAEYVEKARVYDAVADIGVLSATIEGYIGLTGSAPNSLADVNAAGMLDPWGYEYRYNANMNQDGNGAVRKDRSLNPLNSDFDLYSVGKDGATSQSLMAKSSDDDVIRAYDGRFIGLAEASRLIRTKMFVSGGLASKVGRRLTTTFLLVAVMPALVLTFTTYRSIENKRASEIEDQLGLEAKLYGMILFERLRTASSVLESAAPIVSSTGDSDGSLSAEASRIFQSPQVLQREEASVFLSSLLPAQREHLQMPGSTLLITEAADGTTRVLLARSLGAKNPTAVRISVAEVRERFLLGDQKNVSRGLTQIISSTGVLFQIAGAENPEPGTAISADTQSGTWSLYLGAYAHPDWEVRVHEPTDTETSVLSWINSESGVILIFTILVVALLSLTQIRRIMEPLAVLRSSILSVGPGEFSQVQPIKSGDEFEELADTLADMANNLDQSFALQSELSKLDAQILKGENMTDILVSASRCADISLGHRNHAICLFRGTDQSFIYYSGHESEETSSVIGAGTRNLKQLLEKSIALINREPADAFEIEHILSGTGERTQIGATAYNPILIENRLHGFLVSELANEPNAARQQQEKLSYLCTRLAVATSALAQQDMLNTQANFDALTRLPNRRALTTYLSQSISKRGYGGKIFAVLYLDLDGFKDVNDRFGHATGDELLIEAARRLSSVCDGSGFLCRLGGDEFVMVTEQLDAESEIEEIAQSAIDLLVHPFQIGPNTLQVGVSIGAALFPADGNTSESLIKNADYAMYEAKKSAGSTLLRYHPSMRADEDRRLSMRNELVKALRDDKLVWHLQPKVCAASGKILGAECLTRWQEDNGDYIYPNSFIQIAEETGLIEQVGAKAMRRACEYSQTLKTLGYPDLTLSVNVSLREFCSRNFVSQISDILAETGADATKLEVEITESVSAESIEEANAKLHALRDMGLKISMDDFGTGFSSMSYLQHLDFDAIKIDKSFIQGLDSDKSSYAILRAIVEMVHTLGKTVVAEGVETLHQELLLRNLKCDLLQGYLYSKAVPFEDFVAQIDQKSSAQRRLPNLGVA